MESLPQNSTQKFFPVFMSMGALMVSLLFYNVVGTMIMRDASDILGVATVALGEATLAVRTSREVHKYTEIAFVNGDTALDFLTRVEDSTSFSYSAERYDFGYYVYTVNGRRALNNEFWGLVINGEEWIGSIEDYIVQSGDVVELVLEGL